jgi:hypothetical protein
MKISQKTKQTVVAIIIIVIAFFGIKSFFSSRESSDTSLETESAVTSQLIDGQAILALLNKLNRINLKSDIFKSVIFTSLADFEKPIADEAIARKNPFLPIGVEGTNNIILQATTTPRAR